MRFELHGYYIPLGPSAVCLSCILQVEGKGGAESGALSGSGGQTLPVVPDERESPHVTTIHKLTEEISLLFSVMGFNAEQVMQYSNNVIQCMSCMPCSHVHLGSEWVEDVRPSPNGQ